MLHIPLHHHLDMHLKSNIQQIIMGQEIEKDAPSWLRPRDSRDKKELLESCLRGHFCWTFIFKEAQIEAWTMTNYIFRMKSCSSHLKFQQFRIKLNSVGEIGWENRWKIKLQKHYQSKFKKFQSQLCKLTDQKGKTQCLTIKCLQKFQLSQMLHVQLVEWLYKDMVKAWQVTS